MLAVERESNLFGFSRFQTDAFKAGKILFVGGNAAQYIADVELYHFITGTFAGIRHF